MNIIYIKDFNSVDDPVKTEETINTQLIREADKIQTDYTYVSLPLAWTINTYGITHTQHLLSQVCEKYRDTKLFFVCQHILVNKLDFKGNLVFTPHATLLDSYMPLPHYSCNFDISKSKPWKEREYVFSFMGSFNTHPVRRRIAAALQDREDCCAIDTGSWHFEKREDRLNHNRLRYIELLGNTKYSLCPRGTGPSTIRIWESMAMGSCPVIVSDYLKMPLELFLGTKLWLKKSEKCGTIDIDQKLNMGRYDNQEYWDWFSNENLYKSIVENLVWEA